MEENSRPLREKFALPPFLDSADDNEAVNELLEDLREAVGDYMVRSRL